MPELYGRDHFYLNKLEMKCSDIITRYCFCYFHADYPMKFGDAHKYLTFGRYKFLYDENLPVGETVIQMKLHEGYINTNLVRILHEVCTILFPIIVLFVLPHNLNGYELHHQSEAQSSQYSEPMLGSSNASVVCTNYSP